MKSLGNGFLWYTIYCKAEYSWSFEISGCGSMISGSTFGFKNSFWYDFSDCASDFWDFAELADLGLAESGLAESGL